MKGYVVYHDHGPSGENVGNITSWCGHGAAPSRDTALSQLDIAIIELSSQRAIVLVEIEESNGPPKALIGDVFGTLMGDHVTFRNDDLNVGDWTNLIVLGVEGHPHPDRNEFIVRNIKSCQASLNSANRWIREVMIVTVEDEEKLESRLASLVRQILIRGGGAGGTAGKTKSLIQF